MKKPFQHLTPRTIRVIYTACALITLAISTIHILDVMIFKVTSNDECAWFPLEQGKEGLLIKNIVPGGVTDQAGVKEGDVLVRINNRNFKAPGDAQRMLDSLKAGEYATYELRRGDQQLTAQVRILKIFDVFSLSQYLLGLGFLIVGFVVVITRPQGYIQRMFGRYGILSMLVLTSLRLSLDNVRDPRWEIILLVSAGIIGRIFAPPLFIKFFLNFPVRQKVLDKKWFMPFIFVLNLVGFLLLAFNARLGIGSVTLLLLANAPMFYFTVGLGIFVGSYFRQIEPSRRTQIRPVLLSVALGLATYFYITIVMSINPFAIFLTPALVFPALLLIFIPIGFGYAIFRHRLMDIDLVVKRSLLYGTVTAALAVIYLLLVYGFGNLLGLILGKPDNTTLSIAAFIIIAFIFDPVKRRAQESIDRTFYRERHNYQKALLEFSQELPRQMNLEQILTSMVNRISVTMHVEKVAVVLCDNNQGCTSTALNIPVECCSFDNNPYGLVSLLQATRAAQSFVLIEEETEHANLSEEDKEKIISAGIVLSVPILLQDTVIGMINVGPKMSGKIYSQEDTDLLMTVASQAAVAIENARLHVAEVEKHRIEEELKLAWKIQQGLLPKGNPSIAGLDIAGTTIPARTVGGDYYDFIPLGKEKILIVVADVSGKGISAALYMSKVQGMVQLAAQMYGSPKDILIHVNRQMYDGMERNSFITMIVALFDMENHELRLCRAGHNKAIVGTNGEMIFLNATGLGLGLERGPLFERKLEEIHLPIVPQQLFMFYTDGLTEAMDNSNNLFGEETLCRIAKEHQRNGSAIDLQKTIIRNVQSFQGTAEQHDDVTLVIVRTN